jgi:hypothetical protein
MFADVHHAFTSSYHLATVDLCNNRKWQQGQLAIANVKYEAMAGSGFAVRHVTRTLSVRPGRKNARKPALAAHSTKDAERQRKRAEEN